MNSDGAVMRLSKSDFNDHVKDPLITWVSPSEAQGGIANGAVWLDVREEILGGLARLGSAEALPLSKLRESVEALDKNNKYICYCENGRLSSTAAFLLVQRGFDVKVLRGGLKGMKRAGIL